MRLTNAQDVNQNVHVAEGLPDNVVAFQINGGINGENSDGLFIIFNSNNEAREITLPDGVWDVYVNAEKAGTEVLDTITGGVAIVEPISALVLVKGEGNGDLQTSAPADSATGADNDSDDSTSAGSGIVSTVLIIAGVVVIAVGIILVRRKK